MNPIGTAEKFNRSTLALPEAVCALRRELTAYAEMTGASKSASQKLALAIGEALNNAAVHAYVGREPGRVYAEAWCDSGYLYVRILDDGQGMVPRTDSPGLGLGLALMAQMAEDVRVASRTECPGTIVSLKFSLVGEAIPA